MPINMSSQTTLFGLAVFYGLCNALDEVIRGHSLGFLIAHFLGSTVFGTLVLIGIIWCILALMAKKHLLMTVTNWALLISSFISILSALVLEVGV